MTSSLAHMTPTVPSKDPAAQAQAPAVVEVPVIEAPQEVPAVEEAQPNGPEAQQDL